MNEKQRVECLMISGMTSEQAAEWLINRYPISSEEYNEAFVLIPHRSWGRSEQRRLANYYLGKVPFAAGRAYEALASIMPARVLLKELVYYIPEENADVELMVYYLMPALSKCTRNNLDVRAVEEFKDEVVKRLGFQKDEEGAH